jgi:hypothetical protein
MVGNDLKLTVKVLDGGDVWGYKNKESKLCRVGWRSGAWELRGRLKANPPVECEGFVLVGRLSWYRFYDANPRYECRSSTSLGQESGEMLYPYL